jgi:hypothetical protein
VIALGSMLAASCTAILGGVPTGPGSGGAGPGGSSSMPGSGGNGANGGSSRSSAGGSNVSVGPTSSAGGSGGAMSTGSGMVCGLAGDMCNSVALCCPNLVCGSSGICATSTVDAGPPCRTCDDVLNNRNPSLMMCDASQHKLDYLTACVCPSCAAECGAACPGGQGPPGPNCGPCGQQNCPTQVDVCTKDLGCSTCNDMLLTQDVTLGDTCKGTAHDDFKTWINCVCGTSPPCLSCVQTYCAGAGADAICASCLMNGGPAGTCAVPGQACANN